MRVSPLPLLSPLLALLCLLGPAVSAPLAAQEIVIANPNLYEKTLDAARQAVAFYGTYDDPEALRRVADIGYQIALQSKFRDVPFSFYLVDLPVPNAFALPGGQIFVTRGMLDLGLTDDMLANLLGHEIAHVTHRHGTRIQKRARLLNLLSQALVLGVLVGVDDSSEPRDGLYNTGDNRKGSLLQGAMAGGVVLSELLLRNYSRDFEDEADDEGQRLAAAGGWNPIGAQELWALMRNRLPQSNEYGYWRTHPFSSDRERAAGARARELKIQQPAPVEDYRAATQQVLIAFGDEVDGKEAEKLERFAKRSALTAWPRGTRAESLRLAELHRIKEQATSAERAIDRDFGKVVRAYLREIEEVREVDTETTFPKTLEREVADLRAASTEIFPEALAVWEGEIWQTKFLETFLSNFPTVKEAPEVALALGNAYARLNRQADAVKQFLRASEPGTDTEAGERALRGLRNLTPHLVEMEALQRIANQLQDDEVTNLAENRLRELARTFDKLEFGAAYLETFPDGPHAEAIGERIEALADDLYGEVVLYQGVGDLVKALDRINLILTHAPLSRAAAQLREKAMLEAS